MNLQIRNKQEIYKRRDEEERTFGKKKLGIILNLAKMKFNYRRMNYRNTTVDPYLQMKVSL